MEIGYLLGWLRRYLAIFDADLPAPGKLAEFLADAIVKIQTLSDDYKMFTAAPQTELIDEADKARDLRVEQIQNMINSMDKMVGLSTMQQAAHALKPGWDNYKPTAKAALRDESTQIQQWLEYVRGNAGQQQALQTLGLTTIVEELEQYNNQVIQLMDERAAERQQRKAIDIASERKAADRAKKNCDKMLDAYALVDANEHRYDELITNLIADQTEWRQRYKAHLRTAKRVSVKSTVVGNHLYSAARGWTWAQLIDDGKALLKVDEEDETRIVSTDKKAEKAGGLYLALGGVLVKPTDEVDAEKEYLLVALPAE